MNITFGIPHMETLQDLQQIAKKHDMEIMFGFNNHSENDLNEELMVRCGVSADIAEELGEQVDCMLKNANFDSSSVWFELYEKKTDKRNVMTFAEENQYFELDYFDLDSVSTQLSDFIERSKNDYSNCFYFRENPTIVRGFGNARKIKDYRVYRPGMALKYFADLVCDYLGEPRIERVY